MKLSKQRLQQYFWLLPVAYVVIAVFVLRSKVQYIYLAAGLLILLTAVANRFDATSRSEISLARWMAVLAAIGISAAVILSIEKMRYFLSPYMSQAVV